MYYINLENQLFLILVLVFSSFIFLGSLAVRNQKATLKAYGLFFSLPLILAVSSFLISPYHKASASMYLFLSQLFLVLLCTAVMLVRKETDSIKLFFVAPFALAILSLLYIRSFLDAFWANAFGIALGVLLFANLVLMTLAVFTKNKEGFLSHFGLSLIACSQGLGLLYGETILFGVALLGLGYLLCAWYVYRNTFRLFFKDYRKARDELDRINASLQQEVIRRVEEIERSNRRLLEMAKTDSMTGLYLKSAVLKNLDTSLERSPQTALSVLMFDIDKFKQINDSLGHQVGDRCIKTLAGLIQTSFRKEDILGRYGGDEFIVLLPGTPPVKAYLIADRFRQIVEKKTNPHFSISIGIASYPEDAKTAAALIDAADKALYASKQKGRNQATLYSSLLSGRP